MKKHKVELILTLIGTDGIATARRKVKLPIAPFVGLEVWGTTGDPGSSDKITEVGVGLEGEVWCHFGKIDAQTWNSEDPAEDTLDGLLEMIGSGWTLEHRREHYTTNLDPEKNT